MVLLISYDLRGHERPDAYESVKKTIESHAREYIRPLYSQWAVATTESVAAWTQRLQTVVDHNDRLLICQLHQPVNGWLASSDWAWLNARM